MLDAVPLDVDYWFANTGYEYEPGRIKDLGDGTNVFVHRLLFHWTLLHSDNTQLIGPMNKWCYRTLEGAMDALNAFPLYPPSDYEPEGWHKHPYTGRLR